jgi:hypothetical protein
MDFFRVHNMPSAPSAQANHFKLAFALDNSCLVEPLCANEGHFLGYAGIRGLNVVFREVKNKLVWEKPNLREKKSVFGGNSWNQNASVMHQIEKHGREMGFRRMR